MIGKLWTRSPAETIRWATANRSGGALGPIKAAQAPQPGGSYFGTPARGFREASKIHGAMAQLPDALNTIRQLSAEIAQLRKEIEALKAQP